MPKHSGALCPPPSLQLLLQYAKTELGGIISHESLHCLHGRDLNIREAFSCSVCPEVPNSCTQEQKTPVKYVLSLRDRLLNL